jgi:hypothetical protein
VFPTTAVASVLMLMEDGSEVEAGLVGAEGMVGLSVALGLEGALYQSICQVPGGAWRLPARALPKALEGSRLLDATIKRYLAFRLREAAQLVACNTLHPLPKRLGRWLLMSQDRAGRDEFPMTHEFLCELLGVKRQTVAAGTLQAAGLIRYRWGIVRVLDRGRLEEAVCECYADMRDFYDRVFRDPWSGSVGDEVGVALGPVRWPVAGPRVAPCRREAAKEDRLPMATGHSPNARFQAQIQHPCHEPQSNRTPCPHRACIECDADWRFRSSVRRYEIPVNSRPISGSSGCSRRFLFAFRHFCETEATTLRLMS